MSRRGEHRGSTRVAVVGAGSWGTALALVLVRNGHPVALWGRDPEQIARIARDRTNARYLPGFAFPPSLGVVGDLGDALSGARHVLVAVPSHAFRDTLAALANLVDPSAGVVWATKGFDPGTGGLLHETAQGLLAPGTCTGILSGPTFAREVAEGSPAAVALASRDGAYVAEAAELFHGPRLRVYTTDDVIGVQAGAAVKNVLAIAAGIADGLGFGANTRAALITRGLVEMMRLGEALGGRRETFMGLAGLGDLVLTCTDDQSRNRRFGLALARGESVAGAERAVGQVVEGVRTTRVVVRMSRRLGVEMPIAEQVDRVLGGACSPLEAVEALLARAARSEF